MCIILWTLRRKGVKVRHNITIGQDISEELESVAAELKEKKSVIIEKALEVYFDLLDLKVAKKRQADLEAGRDRVLNAEEVWEKLGI
jgi:predicted transcriptional regulator